MVFIPGVCRNLSALTHCDDRLLQRHPLIRVHTMPLGVREGLTGCRLFYLITRYVLL